MTMRTENKLEETFSLGEKNTRASTVKQTASKDKGPGKQQPHPEQLRIAQILDNAKSEDPKLKEKLKQVMEATQKSMDEVFVALHDSDYDPNRAVNLLLEGCEAEWSTSSKKKKTKSPCPTQERGKKEEAPKQEIEDNHCESSGTKQSFGHRGGNTRGRGRGSYQGGRNNNFQQDQNNYRKKISSVAGDDTTHAVIETRYFERARTPVVRPVDTWDPSRPVSSLLNKGPHADDDEEEYTGSLAKSLVITSSCFGKNSHQTDAKINDEQLKNEFEKKLPVSTFHLVSQERVDGSLVEVKSPLLINENGSKPIIGTRAPPITASVVKAPPRIERPLALTVKNSSVLSIEKPSSSEIPTTAVVMPPDCGSNGTLLDITFGSIELNEKENDELQAATLPLPQQIPPPKPKLPDVALTKSEHRVTKDTSLEQIVSESQQSLKDIAKSESINYYESSISHSSYPKSSPKPRSTQNSAFSTDSLCSPSNNLYSSNIPSTFSSSPTIQASSACPQMHYNSFTTQITQSHPVVQNIPNHYENVLGSQTYTSNSQYGTSILPTSTFSVPYPSYSSMVQQSQKQQATTSSFTKELEAPPSGFINSMSYSGVANSSLTANTLPATKTGSTLVSSLGKNNVMSNMPALVGPHPILLGQGGMPYFQQPVYYPDLHLMQQQRLPTHVNPGYYDVNYSSAARDGASYHMNDKMFPLVQHGNHPAATNTEHVSSNIVYGDNFPSHYTGICVSGHEANNTRTDNYKTSIHTSLNPPVLAGVKPIASASKVGSYE